jgi:hypothetical protein
VYNALGDARSRCFVEALKAKEDLVTFSTLFKAFVVVDPSQAVSKLEDRYKSTFNRTRTSRYEMIMHKAIISTTKTAQQKSDAIKEALADHSKATKQVAEDWFFAPLLAEATRLLTLDIKEPVAKKASAPASAISRLAKAKAAKK